MAGGLREFASSMVRHVRLCLPAMVAGAGSSFLVTCCTVLKPYAAYQKVGHAILHKSAAYSRHFAHRVIQQKRTYGQSNVSGSRRGSPQPEAEGLLNTYTWATLFTYMSPSLAVYPSRNRLQPHPLLHDAVLSLQRQECQQVAMEKDTALYMLDTLYITDTCTYGRAWVLHSQTIAKALAVHIACLLHIARCQY